MAFLVAIALSCLAFGGFLLLTAFEQSRDVRLLRVSRERLDARVGRASYVLAHVDWGAFFTDVTRTSAERVLHDVAHTTLLLVRALERLLTRAVRVLRERRQGLLAAPRAERPSIVATTAQYLKTTLRSARRAPKRSDTQTEE